MADTKDIMTELYRNINGWYLSDIAQKNLGGWYVGRVYGEITIEGFRRMLAAVRPQPGEIFYDLGCGVGKPVYLAALLAPFKKSIGIEILDELYKSCVSLMPRFRELTDTITPAQVAFVRGDFKEIDFSDADVIFVNATLMQYEFNIPFIRKLEGLKKGTRVITNTFSFESEVFSAYTIGPVPFTWGEEEVFVHVRK